MSYPAGASLQLVPNSKFIINTLHRGCPKSFKSTITPHTLANFQSLPKLITLIINRFYSHCRGDWQIALTKQNFSDRLLNILITLIIRELPYWAICFTGSSSNIFFLLNSKFLPRYTFLTILSAASSSGTPDFRIPPSNIK